jgi:hypothetical protein
MTVDDYINQLDAPLKEITAALCEIAGECTGDINGTIKWHVPVFSVNRNICSVIAHKAHVNLHVFQGAHLADADLLQGTGKDMRHMRFTCTDEIARDTIGRILRQAIALDAKHG